MILVSHHLLFTTPVEFPEETVVLRINIAWMKNKAELVKLLRGLKHDIYLDYPQGRSKPPRPKMSLEEALALVPQFPNIKYFAVSNVEDPKKIAAIRAKLPPQVELVPKIETEAGVKNMCGIVSAIGTKYVMLDKEDLYVAVKRDSGKFNRLVELARAKAAQSRINILELHGVVFLPYRKGKRATRVRSV